MSERPVDPSVADQMAFESWPEEMKRIARAGLYLEIEAQRQDMEEEVRNDLAEIESAHREDAERWRALVRFAELEVNNSGEVELIRNLGEQADYRREFPALMAMLDRGTVPLGQAVLFFDHAGGV